METTQKLAIPDVHKYNKYVDKLVPFEIVQEILVKEETRTLWVMIDAPPFNEAARLPLFEVAADIIRADLEEASTEFFVENLLEYSPGTRLSDITSPQAKSIWRR